MNEDNKNLHPWIEPELEARVIAWVLGEASDFEIAELDRLVAENPELALFKRRIEAVHGLAGAAFRDARPALRLSPERRRKLLDVIGAPAPAAPKVRVFQRFRPAWLNARALARAAACLVVAGVALTVILSIFSYRESREMFLASREPKQKVFFGGELDQVETGFGKDAKAKESRHLMYKVTQPAPVASTSSPTALASASGKLQGQVSAEVSKRHAEQTAGQQAMHQSLADPEQEKSLRNKADASISAPIGESILSDKAAKVATLDEPAQAAELEAAGSGSGWGSVYAHGDGSGSGGGGAKAANLSRGADTGAEPVPYRESPAEELRRADSGDAFASGAIQESTAAARGGTAISSNSLEAAAFDVEEAPAAAKAAESNRSDTTPLAGQRSSATQLRAGADGSFDRDFAYKQAPSADSESIVARRVLENAQVANQNYKNDASNETRSRMLVAVAEARIAVASEAKKIPALVSAAPTADRAEALVTKEYNVSADLLRNLSAEAREGSALADGKPTIKELLEAGGMTFPSGAAVNYLPGSGKLVVRNTQENLDLADAFVDANQAVNLDAQKKHDRDLQAELQAGEQSFSTFSLHVADVSFLLAKDALNRGEAPDPSRIRPEEFYNAVDYGDPAPAPGEEISCRIEQAAHPLLQQRNLVRIAMKVAATGRAANQPLRLTVLLDTSGSMDREDRADSVRHALASLASLLGPQDRVTLIGFARQPRLLAESVPGNEAGKLVDIASRTPSDGGTNLEAALTLAGELARKQDDPSAQNRIVLLTDGAANLGNADPDRLAKQIEALRQQGIAFDACGVGANGLNDNILEALTRKGDGRYYLLDKPADADAGFAKQLAGALRPAAENVKVQVKFNPARVGRYRLIGFDEHRLETEDFRNDKVDAAELSAEEAAVALYQVEPLPGGEGDLGEVFVRFRDPASGAMVERSWTIPYDAHAPAFDKAPPSMQLAGVAALLAEKLQGRGGLDLEKLAPVVNGLRGHYPNQARVSELVRMFSQVAR